MIFFRKKPKEEKHKEIKRVMGSLPASELTPATEPVNIPELPAIEEPPRFAKPTPILEPPLELPPHPKEETMPRKQYAPLFVKIERYRAVLSMLNELKETIFMLKHGFEIQKQLEDLKNANREVIESAIAKVDKKLLDLDNEFTRPVGFEEEQPIMPYGTENLDITLSDLRKKINDLKSDLKSIA